MVDKPLAMYPENTIVRSPAVPICRMRLYVVSPLNTEKSTELLPVKLWVLSDIKPHGSVLVNSKEPPQKRIFLPKIGYEYTKRLYTRPCYFQLLGACFIHCGSVISVLVSGINVTMVTD